MQKKSLLINGRDLYIYPYAHITYHLLFMFKCLYKISHVMTEPKKRKAIQANNLWYITVAHCMNLICKKTTVYLIFMKSIRTTTLVCEGAWYKKYCWINDHHS